MDSVVTDLNTLNRFLAVHDDCASGRYDLILLLGNALGTTAISAYELYRKGKGKRLMIAGGRGHTSDILLQEIEKRYCVSLAKQESEAELLRYVMEQHYGRDETILLEKCSTNCGENIRFAFDLLHREKLTVQSVLLLHDPLLQRRMDATARKQIPNVQFYNYSCFVPEVIADKDDFVLKKDHWGLWPKERYLSLVLGEMKRLRNDSQGYGSKGADFIADVTIPDEVEMAYQRVLHRYPDYLRN